jgi:alpha-glucosidase (family GH31 glycosyl hydrolase)
VAYGEQNVNIRLAPDGHRLSNRANLLLRYELSPYLYRLAHRAHRFGAPVFPPLVYHFLDDPNVRRMGNVKLVGDGLLFGVVATFGQTDRRVYLPRGRWVDYHSLHWHDSTGTEIAPVPLYRERHGEPRVFTIPLFARAGAIIPQSTSTRKLGPFPAGATSIPRLCRLKPAKEKRRWLTTCR